MSNDQMASMIGSQTESGASPDDGHVPEARPGSSKNIVVLSDGTGNAGGIANGTNVWRIRQALKLVHQGTDKPPGGANADGTPDEPREQVVIYEDGVGTETFRPLAILGLGFALGITRDLQTLYSRLMQAYEPGDRIYLFGFSRGAFTIRVLAYILYRCGLADICYQQNGLRKRRSPEQVEYVAREAIGAYKLRHLGADTRFRQQYGIPAKRIRDRHCYEISSEQWPEPNEEGQGRVPIHFIGVWDTVDAVGIVFDNLNQWILWFWRRITRIPGLSFLRFGLLNYHRPDRSRAGRSIACPVWSGVETLSRSFPLSDSTKTRISDRKRRWSVKEWPTWEDDDLHQYIQAAFHAISVDDERRTFHPVLWLEFNRNRLKPPGVTDRISPDQDVQYERKCPPNEQPEEPPKAGHGCWGLLKEVEQVWFSGVHANVGGGYPKDQLSLVALSWMLRNASKYELLLNGHRTRFEEQQDPLGRMYDSRSGAAMYYRYKPRSVRTICEQVGIDGTQPDRSPKISATVLERIQKSTAAYAPNGIPLADEYIVVQKPRPQVAEPEIYDEQKWPEQWQDRVEEKNNGTGCTDDECLQFQKEARAEASRNCKRLSDLRLFCYYGLWGWTLIFVLTGLTTDPASLTRFDHTGHRWMRNLFQTWPLLGESPIVHVLQVISAGAFAVWCYQLFKERRAAKTSTPLELIEPGRGAGIRSLMSTVSLPFLAGLAAFLARPVLELISLSVAPEAAEPIVQGIVQSPVLVFLFAASFAALTVVSAVAKHRMLSWSVYGWQCSLRGPQRVRKPRVTVWEWFGGTSLIDSNGKLGVILERYVLPLGGLLLLGLVASLILKPAWRDFFIRLDIERAAVSEVPVTDETRVRQTTPNVSPASGSRLVMKHPVRLAFDPARVLATDHKLETDGVYEILLNVDVWMDGSIEAQKNGTIARKDETAAMTAMKLMTTEPREPYFQLLGSIGVPGRDPFPIRSGFPFVARRSGELFLWVNDVPAFHYNNKRANNGQDNLTIRRIDD